MKLMNHDEFNAALIEWRDMVISNRYPPRRDELFDAINDYQEMMNERYSDMYRNTGSPEDREQRTFPVV